MQGCRWSATTVDEKAPVGKERRETKNSQRITTVKQTWFHAKPISCHQSPPHTCVELAFVAPPRRFCNLYSRPGARQRTTPSPTPRRRRLLLRWSRTWKRRRRSPKTRRNRRRREPPNPTSAKTAGEYGTVRYGSIQPIGVDPLIWFHAAGFVVQISTWSFPVLSVPDRNNMGKGRAGALAGRY